jgi:hypothetical protein
MGGAVVSRELFPGREEYENWSLDCVQQTMAQLKAEHGTIYDRAMDRSHYFNLFNNYEHQNAVTGSFMTLPMDHFSRYLAGEAEKSDDGVLRIHLRRPLAMLTLLCDVEGTDSALDRLKMLLELATASATAEAIARPELERLLLDVAQGLRVCGVLKGDVKPKDIADMADNVWKRADGPAANGGTGATTSLPVAKLWALCQKDFIVLGEPPGPRVARRRAVVQEADRAALEKVEVVRPSELDAQAVRAAAPVRPEDGIRNVRVRRRPVEGPRRRRQVQLRQVRRAAVLEADLGRKRVIQRRFNVSVPRARVPEKASTLRDRSER